MIPIFENILTPKARKVLRWTCAALVCVSLFLASCVHFYKVNEMHLKGDIGTPYLVILVTL